MMRLTYAHLSSSPICRQQRRCALVQASGKGFGSKPDQPQAKPDEVKQAVKAAGKRAVVRKGQGKQAARMARPVDPTEAAKGKLDVVEVQDWGSGQPEMLGNLKVQRLERMYKGAGSTSSSGPDSSSSSSGTAAGQGQGPQGEVKGTGGKSEMSFYDQLTREVAMAEKRGCLAVAGGPSLPLEQWSFTDARYLQYLTDCLAVHDALETSLQGLPATGTTDQAGMGSVQALAQALACLASAGLGRAAALRRDMQAITASPRQTQNSSSPPASTSLEPGQMAKSHAAHIARLGRDVRAGVAAATAAGAAPTPAQAEALAAAQEAAPKLLAQVFVVQLVHLAGGMRFGAAAVDKMGLFERRAIALYHEYPPVMKEPLHVLQDAMNTAGVLLSGPQKQGVLEELPRAMRSASLLMEALAYAD